MASPDATQLLKSYNEDGYVIARNVIDADLAREACDHVKWLLGKNPDVRGENLHNWLMVGDPFWHRLVSDDNPKIIHGSNANTSDQWRVGLTIRYIPTTTKIVKPGAGSPYLLRGEAMEGINQYHPRLRRT